MASYCDPVLPFVEEKIIGPFFSDDDRPVVTSRPQNPRISFGQKTSPFDLPGVQARKHGSEAPFTIYTAVQ
jgi:hypothetical protein